MKSILKALRSGSASKGRRDGGTPAPAGEDENTSPSLAPPNRLLSFTSGSKTDNRLRQTKNVAKDGASVRARGGGMRLGGTRSAPNQHLTRMLPACCAAEDAEL